MQEFHPHLKEAIEEVDWQLDTVEEQLLRCDIGLVPGIVDISDDERKIIIDMLKLTREETLDLGGYGTYLLHFKGLFNGGRSFVFHQLRIPVVGCFMPSHFHILGNPDCVFLAHSTEGWLRGLKALCASARKRQQVADADREEFYRQYDPLDSARRLYGQIHDLCKESG